ncbi:MAG TPA: hypothetical protein VHY08_25895 [Bacillota bacterium]|nr:hypothetical protein [Bacillota bacterium]
MRELIVNISDEDIAELMKMFKTNDEHEAVRMAVNEVIKKQQYSRILALNGQVPWEGNLDVMREPRA